jgi:radical SAM protein with 4Fe4S-binding SPASM domain
LTGSESGYFPIHATIEIIETCNFTCAHCYYQSSPSKKGLMPLVEATALLDKLADNGVRVVDITGGECTIHRNFREILSYAAQRFEFVAVISNGYRFGTDPGLADFAAAFPNTMFQISIDAIGPVHDKFRKHRGSFDAAVRAVERFVTAGKIVRISSSIAPETIDQVIPLYELGKRLGVARHSFAPVSSIGRGCNVTDPGAGARELLRAINAALAPHIDEAAINPRADLPPEADDLDDTRNCGAGWRTVAIDYDGNVRACNFSRDSKKFGNALTEDYRAIFEQPAQFLFNNAPSPGGADCQGCAYMDYCQGCFVKAFTLSENVYKECAWRRRWFPGMSLGLDPDRFAAKSLDEKRSAVPAYSSADSPFKCNSCGSCGSTGKQ